MATNRKASTFVKTPESPCSTKDAFIKSLTWSSLAFLRKPADDEMRNFLIKRLNETSCTGSSKSYPSLPFSLSATRQVASAAKGVDEAEGVLSPREDTGVSCGLNSALAAKGVIVKDKAFLNLKSSELKQKGATIAEFLSGIPLHVRGNVAGGALDISKAQFRILLKQVTSHLSSISDVFVHDGALGSESHCDVQVRIISDNASAILSLSNILYKTPDRAVSHDTCPLTVYNAASISSVVADAVGVGSQAKNGFIAADVERSSLILCGKAFADSKGLKRALTSLSEPIISARGGILLPGRLLVSGDSVIILFASEETIRSCSNSLVSADAGVIFSPHRAVPLFQTRHTNGAAIPFKLPSAVVLASSDSSGSIPSVSKLSPGQAAYHFLSGYQNGNFVSAYIKGPSTIDPLHLAKALLSKLKDNTIPTFLINVNEGEKILAGEDIIALVESTLSSNIQPFQAKGELWRKYKMFLSGKYNELPEEFSF